jgi:RsiW-degrading membrane proteinase PrsW (M82 family)
VAQSVFYMQCITQNTTHKIVSFYLSFLHYLIPIFFSFVPALVWAYVFWRKDFLDPQPLKMLLYSFGAGMLAAGLLIWERDMLAGLVAGWNISWFVTFFFAAIEEVLKILFLLLVGKFLCLRFTQMIDGAIYGVLVGLGFAFVENVVYFMSVYTGSFDAVFWQVFGFRSLGSLLLHALTTGIFGLFWGYAIYSQRIAPKDSFPLISFLKNFFKSFSFHVLREHILKGRPSQHGHEKIQIIQEGVRTAIVLHFLFNISLEYTGITKSPLMIPALFLLCLMIWFSRQFLKKRNVEIFRPI